MCTCTFRQLVPTNNFKAYKAFPGYVPLMMLLTFLLMMIMCKQYAVDPVLCIFTDCTIRQLIIFFHQSEDFFLLLV